MKKIRLQIVARYFSMHKALALAGASLLITFVFIFGVECSIPSLAKMDSNVSPSAYLSSSANAGRALTKGHEHLSPPASGTKEAYGKLPLSFEANEGQFDSRATFLARGEGYGLFLTKTGAVFSLRKHSDQQAGPKTSGVNSSGTHSEDSPTVLSMRLEGARPSPQITGLDKLPGSVNYFIGSDRHKWRKQTHTYSKVRYGNVYPGVDVIYYGSQRQLEYDFVIAPGADLRHIRLAYAGATTVKVDESGDLVLSTGEGDVFQ